MSRALWQKLGYAPGTVARLDGDPADYAALVAGLPDGVTFTDDLDARPGLVHLFVTERDGLAAALPLGLVDVKVCAVDATWTALKLVIRTALREGRIFPTLAGLPAPALPAPMLSRRQFVARSAAAAAALPFVAPLASAAPRRAPFTSLRRGVGYFTERGGTIGYLQTPQALVAVDAQFPDSAQAFLDGLRAGSDRGLDLLVNTHHHGDHTAGNAVLAPAAQLHVAHESVPGLQRAAAVRSGDLGAQPIAPVTFRDYWRTGVGDEVVALAWFGPAHTAGDAVVHFERADVVHMGDLVFNRRQPYIDRGAGATVEGWIGVLEAVHERHGDDTVFVFGHAGDGFDVVGARADLLLMRDFLTALGEAAVSAAGATPPETAAALEGTVLPGFEAWGPIPSRVAAPLVDEFARSE